MCHCHIRILLTIVFFFIGQGILSASVVQGVGEEGGEEGEVLTMVADDTPLQEVVFSGSMLYPDSGRPNQFVDSLLQLVTVRDGDFMRWVHFTQQFKQDKTTFGIVKKQRESWILLVFSVTILFFGIIKTVFPVETLQIVQAFYNDRVLAQINKEDTLYSSWPFMFFYMLFGFSCGLFLYVLSVYAFDTNQPVGIESFVKISVFVLILFSLKILVTRLLGIIFDAKRMVREYISVLYLSYFNASLIFIPAVLVLCFTPQMYNETIVLVVFLIAIGLFAYRILKTANKVLEKYRFPKFYLFAYLCTLELVPLLLLAKVLS